MREAIKTFKLKRILKHENFFIISGKNSFFKSKFKNHFEFKNQNNIFLKKIIIQMWMSLKKYY